jgi:hypothetical protein
MKFCKLALCFTVLLGMACLPAHAQSSIRIDVPFDFAVGNYTLPAGQYYVSPALSGASLSDATVVVISNRQHAVNVITTVVQANGEHHGASLLFKHDGSQYSLMQVWSADGDIGLDVSSPKFREVPSQKMDKNTQIAKGLD